MDLLAHLNAPYRVCVLSSVGFQVCRSTRGLCRTARLKNLEQKNSKVGC